MKAVSGPNFVETEFSVTPSQEQGMSVVVTNLEKSFQVTLVTIKGFGASVSHTVVIEITSSEGEKIEKLTVFSTGVGDFSTIWLVDKETPPGTYTIKASDALDSAETTFELE